MLWIYMAAAVLSLNSPAAADVRLDEVNLNRRQLLLRGAGFTRDLELQTDDDLDAFPRPRIKDDLIVVGLPPYRGPGLLPSEVNVWIVQDGQRTERLSFVYPRQPVQFEVLTGGVGVTHEGEGLSAYTLFSLPMHRGGLQTPLPSLSPNGTPLATSTKILMHISFLVGPAAVEGLSGPGLICGVGIRVPYAGTEPTLSKVRILIGARVRRGEHGRFVFGIAGLDLLPR